ncbi:MAG: bifunctional UDP-sugar hydrolase/5'-nucleotidase [Eubacteriales bacterium]
MKQTRHSFLLTILLICALILPSYTALATTTTSNSGEIVILYTNDTHCAIESGIGFAGVAAYKADMIELYGEDYVTLIDSGDAVQGGSIGTLTNGEAIIEIMNAVGYDYMAPGNHEFDYGMEQFFYLMDLLAATPISCNFMDLTTNTQPFDSYEIKDYNGIQIAYVGISTPETLTSSNPTSFQDANGNYIYGFSEDATGESLYTAVQGAVDEALAEGADYVVAVGHLGTGDSVWSSLEVIGNTSGIDVFIDGHSHSTIEGQEVLSETGETVLLTQGGSKLTNLGKITIDPNTDTITTQLISSKEDSDTYYEEKDSTVSAVIDSINEEFEELLNQVVASTTYALDKVNLGALITDAYCNALGADVAIMNGGGIRATIDAGDITYEDMINVQPFGNEILSLELSGQTILDALEYGSTYSPDDNTTLLYVSGITYSIDTTIESSAQTDDYGNFVSIDGAYRVTNVMVNGEPLDVTKTYTVASHDYYLLYFGDGMVMFQDGTVVNDPGITDTDILMDYILTECNGVVGDEYADDAVLNRITYITTDSALDSSETTADATLDSGSTTEDASSKTNGEYPVTLLLGIGLTAIGIGALLMYRKKKS